MEGRKAVWSTEGFNILWRKFSENPVVLAQQAAPADRSVFTLRFHCGGLAGVDVDVDAHWTDDAAVV